jgi:hypothetical protein
MAKSRKIPKVIMLAGNSGVGKNSMLDCLGRYFSENKLPYIDYISIGDICREEVMDFCLTLWNIDPFTKNRAEKEIIRPIIVETVKINKKRNPNYYVEKIKGTVQKSINLGSIPTIPDCRYLEEYSYLKKLGGILIFIERYNEDGLQIPPANEEEKINNIKLRERADYIVTWPTLRDGNEMYEHVLNHFISWFK